MVRPKKQSEPKTERTTTEPEPEILERKRLKKLAVSKNILSNKPPKPHSSLAPSKTVIKHHGTDIIRKSHRKTKFLFSFPGLIAPIAGGGKIGELQDLASKNPVLYLHFPQGQMKLFGTIVYPKNRYLTLHFSRGGKSVMCEDYFDNMIVFSDAWWIGTKEENPDEVRLDIPKELIKGQSNSYDFKGGAGGTSVSELVGKRSEARTVEADSPETELEADSSDDKTNLGDLKDTTPSRHSARMAGKKFKFTEASSGDDSLESDNEIFENQEEKVKGSSVRILNIDNEIASTKEHSEEDQSTVVLETKFKRRSESSLKGAKSEEGLPGDHGSLVQSTISSLFKKAQEKEKVEEKKASSASRKSSSIKDFGQMQQSNLKRKTNKVESKASNKRTKATKGEETGTKTKAKKKSLEDEDDDDDDDIEDFSSSAEDKGEGSDEDWEA